MVTWRPGGFSLPIKQKVFFFFFWEETNNRESTDICTYCFWWLMKLRGFGHNKRAYCTLCAEPECWRLLKQRPPQSKHAALCLFTSVNALLFSAAFARAPGGSEVAAQGEYSFGTDTWDSRTGAPPSLCVWLMRPYWLHCFVQTVSSLTPADIP